MRVAVGVVTVVGNRNDPHCTGPLETVGEGTGWMERHEGADGAVVRVSKEALR